MASRRPGHAPPLGRRIVLTVVLGAVLPLGLIGLWTTQSAARSGRELLRTQLEAELDRSVRELEGRLERRTSDLLLLAENEPVRLALRDSAAADAGVPEFVVRAFSQMQGFNRVVIRDAAERTRWTLEAPGVMSVDVRPPQFGDTRGVRVRLPVMDLVAGDTIGSVEASIRAALLVPSLGTTPSPGGTLIALFVRDDGAIVPPTVDERLFRDEGVEWSAHRWLSVRRRLEQPAVEVVVAGALDPYVVPFRRSARTGATALLVAALAIVLVVVVLTQRMTREIDREFAQREALAAVGEFASELAHEVRNPLTAIRLDLQRVEEVASDGAAVRGIVSRSLRQIERLDRAVTGALRVARGRSATMRSVRLNDVIVAAARAAEPEFAHRHASLRVDPTTALQIELDGDAGALEQMFLNLLINAAQSLSMGGGARVSTSVHNGVVDVAIVDNGAGMSRQQLEQVQEPFRSTKRDGTGLGLKIARRIAGTHGGEIALESSLGFGTTVRVRFPRQASAQIHTTTSVQ